MRKNRLSLWASLVVFGGIAAVLVHAGAEARSRNYNARSDTGLAGKSGAAPVWAADAATDPDGDPVMVLAPGEAASVPTETCEASGAYELVFEGRNRYRGNMFRIEFSGTVLQAIKWDLAFDGKVDLHFSIHRRRSDSESLTLTRSVPDCVIEDAQGNGLTQTPKAYTCTLPSPGLELERGYDYAIGVSWGTARPFDPDVRFGRDSGDYPEESLHGQVLCSLTRNIAPPLDDTVTFIACYNGGVYSMQLCFEPVPGACCIPPVGAAPGRCAARLKDDCDFPGGFFHGERTDCREVACSFGACCLPCGGCLGDYTVEACEDETEGEGGSWAGRGVDCQVGLCPVVTGACCEDSSCSEVCVDECDAREGEYLGHGTTCFPNFCAGACCIRGFGCADLTEEVCPQVGGAFAFRGTGTTCAALAPEDECGGACCGELFSQPICFSVDQRSECTDQPPDLTNTCYLGDEVGCACPAAACGACCLPDGSCVRGTSSFCEVADGHFVAGATCDGITCPMVCCVPGEDTEARTECRMTPDMTTCFLAGGRPPIVPADNCVPNPCVMAPGACCFNVEGGDADGDGDVDLRDHAYFQVCFTGEGPVPVEPQCALFDLDPSDDDVDLEDYAAFHAAFGRDTVVCEDNSARIPCKEAGGRFQEGDTDCASTCPTCFGACCRPNGSCTDQISKSECRDVLRGAFRGCATICADVEDVCEQGGACCAETGACLFLLESECDAIGGKFTTVGETCSSNTCPTGACCLPDVDGRCELRRSDRCPAEGDPPGSVYQGDGTVCDPGLCNLGACCDEHQACFFVFDSQCSLVGGEFSAGVDCNDNDTCHPGACCAEGDCSAQTLAACEASGGVYQKRGRPCEARLCTLGRCCERDGSCRDDVVASQCAETNGVFGALITCDSGVRCEQIGACCLRDGSCVDDQLTSHCEDAGGTLTPNGTCNLVTCPRVGACCDNGVCISDEGTEDQCVQSGGLYQGDGSVCTLAVCTLGSCCDLDGTCTDGLVGLECDARNGLFRPGITCEAGPSCDRRGACCLRDGGCVDDVLPLTCASHEGELTPDTLCDAVTCEALGACCDNGVCTEGTRPACEGSAGIYQGDDTACAAGSCPVGACCNAGLCTQQSETACVVSGGDYQGDGAPCEPGLCATGACCHLDGTCDEGAVAAECAGLFDVFSAFTACASACLVGRGACCPPDAACQDAMPELLCQNQGGDYHGDGTLCQADLCEVGACCLPGGAGTCDDATFTRLACEAAGGAYQGAGSTCVQGLCTVGSCCATDTTCTDDVVASQCEDPNVFRMDRLCVDEECSGRGACCVAGQGCAILSAAECGGLAGIYGGDSTTCVPGDLCDSGACCRFNDTCAPQARMLCEQQGGVYQGAGIDCTLDEVDCARGACCEMDGTCRDGVFASSCTAAGSVFEAGGNCSGMTCQPRGACCELGACAIKTRGDCLRTDGEYQGSNVSCETDTCAISIVLSNPPNCAIDAREPTDPDGNTTFGWISIELTFDGDASGLGAADFSVEVIPGPDGVPNIVDLTASESTATLELDPPIPPGHWTCITHDPSGTKRCLGFLPADSDGNGTSLATDTTHLAECLDGVASCALWQCDLDHSGQCAPADVSRSIDLLNGAAAYDVWLDASLPACPSAP